MTASSACAGQRAVSLDPLKDPRWDRFVRSHDRASAYHLSDWAAILASAYRFRVRYLALEDAHQRLRAVMPLMYKRGPVSGARLRSLPVVPFCGPLADTDALERDMMVAACNSVPSGAQLVVTTSSSSLVGLPGVACRPGLPRWIVPLDGSVDPSRWRCGGRNPARGVRKAEAAGVRVREARSAADLRTFYRLYLRAQRRLRALPRRLAQLTLDRSAFGPEGVFRLFLAEHEGRTIAGTLWHAFGPTMDGLYYGGDERFTGLAPNHAMYSHVLDWALEHGYEELDLGGAASGSSLAYFKSQWGAEPVPLYFYVYPARAAPPDSTRPPAPSSIEIADHRVLDSVWQLAPLDALRVAGTLAYRYL